ncbi:MAG: SAM-dependent methyltransferase [Proteobacteria bacterium]|nr:SAM-dependent methyltransferase [Pseudomonadota bacterium]
MVDTSSLPDPDHAALERSRQLAARIRDAIHAAGGMIGFDTYMAMALYEPALGYYTGGGAIFGRDGDFITAPEAGGLFAACLARQCADVLTPDDDIVEYGAGSGRLACDLLTSLAHGGPLPARYCIVEPSAALRVRQQAATAQLPESLRSRLHWYDEHAPAGSHGLVIANEVLDAMPVTRCVVRAGAWHECMVAVEDERLVWTTRPYHGQDFDPAWAARLPDGYVSEANPGLAAWLATLRSRLSRALVLLADYGYPRHEYLHPSRGAGTLKCHYLHHVHDDPLLYPGLQDITASVDFTAVAEQAFEAGFDILGYVTQAHFLIDCGLEQVLASAAANDTERYRLAQEAKLLLMPGSMGQTFKVMALGVGEQPALRGFRHDERHRLDGFAT